MEFFLSIFDEIAVDLEDYIEYKFHNESEHAVKIHKDQNGIVTYDYYQHAWFESQSISLHRQCKKLLKFGNIIIN